MLCRKIFDFGDWKGVSQYDWIMFSRGRNKNPLFWLKLLASWFGAKASAPKRGSFRACDLEWLTWAVSNGSARIFRLGGILEAFI